MIKVLKHGNKQKYTKVCPECGCEFEYELSDVETDYSICLTSYPAQYNRFVRCPECGCHVHHDTTSSDWPKWPNVIYTNAERSDDCEGCKIYEDAKKGILGINDACYWCSKNKYRVVCGDSCTTTYTTTKNDEYKNNLEDFQKDL